ARRHNARLVGVFGQRGQAQQVGLVATWPSPDYAAAAKASRTAFNCAVAGLGDSEWRDINRGSDSEVIRLLVDSARHFDLAILGQYESCDSHLPRDLVEMMIMDSGRPVLVVPFAGEFSVEAFDHPLVAWNDAREAARALNDALPLIAACKSAVVVQVTRDNSETRADRAALLQHLVSHGVPARMEVVTPETERIPLMDALLNCVTDQGATLLVMGAQSHSNNPFGGRGEGTRYVLEHMTVPVLMSH
ncbi:MAG: universal stress protein, partial [Rhodocyclaceae bacterium]